MNLRFLQREEWIHHLPFPRSLVLLAFANVVHIYINRRTNWINKLSKILCPFLHIHDILSDHYLFRDSVIKELYTTLKYQFGFVYSKSDKKTSLEIVKWQKCPEFKGFATSRVVTSPQIFLLKNPTSFEYVKIHFCHFMTLGVAKALKVWEFSSFYNSPTSFLPHA